MLHLAPDGSQGGAIDDKSSVHHMPPDETQGKQAVDDERSVQAQSITGAPWQHRPPDESQGGLSDTTTRDAS